MDNKDGATASGEQDNAELARLFADDQGDRRSFEGPAAVATEQALQRMRANDRVRRVKVEELLAQGAAQTATDFYHAAYIFQHGGRLSVEDWIIAHQLAMVSAFMGNKEARWLCAASYDRVLLALGHAQCLGTQFSSNAEGRYQLDECTNILPDAIRARFGLRPIADARDTSNGINSRLDD